MCMEQFLQTLNDYSGLLVAAATILLGVIAIWGDQFNQWRRRPKLSIKFSESAIKSPYYKKAPTEELRGQDLCWTDCIWVRFRIMNEGKTPAKSCLVRIIEVRADGKTEEGFDPVILAWGGYGRYPSIGPPRGDVYPNVPELAGFCYLPLPAEDEKNEKNEKNEKLVIYDPASAAHPTGIKTHYGEDASYQFDILITCENGREVKKTITLDSKAVRDNYRD